MHDHNLVNWSFTFDPIYWDAIHFFGSYFLVSMLHYGLGLSLEDASVVAFTLGLAWEIKDVWKDDGFGVKDLSLDGAAIGLYWKIHLGKKKKH
ncbi:MAG TPA: hypothetical protein VJ165_01635 [candidate division Zixibacteria bacterium]|nr:hypothetical protein [candidate division Zixibacteria bacterium]